MESALRRVFEAAVACSIPYHQLEIEARVHGHMIHATSIARVLVLKPSSNQQLLWKRHRYIETFWSLRNDHRRCVLRQRHDISSDTSHCATTWMAPEQLAELRQLYNDTQPGRIPEGDVITAKSALLSVPVDDEWTHVTLSSEQQLTWHDAMTLLDNNIPERQYRLVERIIADWGHATVEVVHSIDHDERDQWRVEIEACEYTFSNIDKMAQTIRRVQLALTTDHGCTEIMTESMYESMALLRHTRLFPRQYQKPVSLTRRECRLMINGRLNRKQYRMTAKVDGVRCFLVARPPYLYRVDLKGTVVLLTNALSLAEDTDPSTQDASCCSDGESFASIPSRVSSIESADDTAHGHHGDRDVCSIAVLDAEMVEEGDSGPIDYHIIDAVAYNDRRITAWPLIRRIAVATTLAQTIEPILFGRVRSVRVKPYQPFHSLHELVQYKESIRHDITTDGIVFTSTGRYRDQAYKWKYQLTVDLVCRPDGFGAADAADVLGSVEFDMANTSRLAYGAIAEFNVERRKGQVPLLRFSRWRADKASANTSRVCEDVLYRALDEAIFIGRGALLMRKIHNSIKRKMYKQAGIDGKVLLDIGTGQGGDLDKWKGASHVYCVERDAACIERMRQRYGTMLESHSITLIHADVVELASMSHRRNDVPLQRRFDVMSVFFCLNLFEPAHWASLQQILHRWAAPHCTVIGIVMSLPKPLADRANTISSYCEISNDVFDLKFWLELQQQGQGLIRSHIRIDETHVQDVHEILYDMEDIHPVFEAEGFRLDYTQRLSDQNMTRFEKMLSSMYVAFRYVRN